ncbi:MAG: oxidoreductase [Rhodobacteraceae bacterium]|nr:MAG: oxidoreductase [Paracoccaceae bacterium]
MSEKVIIVGVGQGLSASLARLFHKEGMQVVLAARDTKKLKLLAKESNAKVIVCDSSNIDDVENLFKKTDDYFGLPDVVVYNPSFRVRGAISSCDPIEVRKALDITCYGAFLVAQQAVNRMKKLGHGSLFFTGATAGVKGFANSSVFAMGKFGLRGLAQSLARELHPENIHVGHFVIDGSIGPTLRGSKSEKNYDDMLNPDDIAKSYLDFHRQKRNSWSWEIELRPWIEKF